MKTLIKNINLITHEGKQICDILIQNSKIESVGKSLMEKDIDVTIDGTGKTAFPGLVDMHCHLRDPGFLYKEDIESGSKSAAAGGFTSIVAMPNTNPVISTASPMIPITMSNTICMVFIFNVRWRSKLKSVDTIELSRRRAVCQRNRF